MNSPAASRSLMLLACLLGIAFARAPTPPEAQVVQDIRRALEAEPIPCPNYSPAFPAGRIRLDRRWTCLLVPSSRDPQVFSAALLVALNRVYHARLARIFSPLAPNPDCECHRFAVYYRRQGRLIAWSFSYLNTHPYGNDAILWIKHEAL